MKAIGMYALIVVISVVCFESFALLEANQMKMLLSFVNLIRAGNMVGGMDMALLYFRMVIPIKVNTKMINVKAKEFTNGTMAVSTKDSLSMINAMDRVYLIGPMVPIMKVNSIMANDPDKANTSLLPIEMPTVAIMQVVGKMASTMVLALVSGVMVENIVGNGHMVWPMVEALKLSQMVS